MKSLLWETEFACKLTDGPMNLDESIVLNIERILPKTKPTQHILATLNVIAMRTIDTIAQYDPIKCICYDAIQKS